MSDETTPLPAGGARASHQHDQDTATFTDWPTPPTAAGNTTGQPGPTPEPRWITGPSAPTLLAGLLTLVIAALAIVRLSTDVAIEWSIAAPVTVIAVGVIAVVLGAASFSRRSPSAEHESTE